MKIKMTIVQPRLDHISTWTISLEKIIEWSEKIKAAALAALDPEAPVIPGEKQCRLCPAKFKCRQRAIHALQSVTDTELMTPAEMAQLIPLAKEVKHWAQAFLTGVEESAHLGTIYPGYKLVHGRATRKWRDDVEFDPELFTQKLVGITEAEKLIGKERVSQLTVKPEGKLTLVPSSDKRPEVLPIAFPIGD